MSAASRSVTLPLPASSPAIRSARIRAQRAFESRARQPFPESRPKPHRATRCRRSPSAQQRRSPAYAPVGPRDDAQSTSRPCSGGAPVIRAQTATRIPSFRQNYGPRMSGYLGRCQGETLTANGRTQTRRQGQRRTRSPMSRASYRERRNPHGRKFPTGWIHRRIRHRIRPVLAQSARHRLLENC